MENKLQDRLGGYVMAHHSGHPAPKVPAGYSVTISREAGAGGSSVAQHLAAYLEKHQPPDGKPWAVFDHNLVEKALEQHRLPKRLEHFMPEDAAHMLSDTVEDLLGLHPASSELVRRVSETMLSLARRGNVILVGRGGNIITSRLANAFHARLIGPRAIRLKNVQRHYNLSARTAEEFLAKKDRARKRYLRQNFGARIDDPLGYDLIINMGRVAFDEAAMLIGTAVMNRMSHRHETDDPQGDAVRFLARSRAMQE